MIIILNSLVVLNSQSIKNLLGKIFQKDFELTNSNYYFNILSQIIHLSSKMFSETKTTLHFSSPQDLLNSVGQYFDFFFQDVSDKDASFYDIFLRRVQPSVFNVPEYTMTIFPEKRLTTFAVKYHDIRLVEEDKGKSYFSFIAKEGQEEKAQEEAAHILDIVNYLTGQMKTLKNITDCTPHVKNTIGEVKIKIPTNKKYPMANIETFNAEPGYLTVRLQCGWILPPKDGAKGKYGVTLTMNPWKTKETLIKKRADTFANLVKKRKAYSDAVKGLSTPSVFTQDYDFLYTSDDYAQVEKVAKVEDVLSSGAITPNPDNTIQEPVQESVQDTTSSA